MAGTQRKKDDDSIFEEEAEPEKNSFPIDKQCKVAGESVERIRSKKNNLVKEEKND